MKQTVQGTLICHGLWQYLVQSNQIYETKCGTPKPFFPIFFSVISKQISETLQWKSEIMSLKGVSQTEYVNVCIISVCSELTEL